MFTSYLMANNFLFSPLAKNKKFEKYWSYCTQGHAITNALLNLNKKRLYFRSELPTITKHKFHHKTEAHGKFYDN